MDAAVKECFDTFNFPVRNRHDWTAVVQREAVISQAVESVKCLKQLRKSVSEGRGGDAGIRQVRNDLTRLCLTLAERGWAADRSGPKAGQVSHQLHRAVWAEAPEASIRRLVEAHFNPVTIPATTATAEEMAEEQVSVALRILGPGVHPLAEVGALCGLGETAVWRIVRNLDTSRADLPSAMLVMIRADGTVSESAPALDCNAVKILAAPSR